jgi:hypothetical protein
MSERSIKSFDYYQALQQQAEYLLVGLLAASIAFFWQSSKPERLGLTPATLHLVGLVFLFLAIVVALIKLHRQPFIHALNSELLELSDQKSSLVQSASQGKTVVSGVFGIMEPSQQAKRIQILDQQIASVGKKIAEIDRLCSRLYSWRNFLLVSGYLIFVVHRIWLPYFG